VSGKDEGETLKPVFAPGSRKKKGNFGLSGEKSKKIRHVYNNNPPRGVGFMPAIASKYVWEVTW
jgi:hypothetical protein